MKIQYASDLHLEFTDNWRYLKESPLQVVVGDILLFAGRCKVDSLQFCSGLSMG